MLTTSSIYKTSVAQLSRASDAKIFFGIYDVTAKTDSTPVASNSQTFAPISGIKDNIRVPQFSMATFEDDLFNLDGSLYLVPDDVSSSDLLGWWSTAESASDGIFATPPSITITFSSLHSSLGIGLFFDPSNGDTCDSFNITWYNGTTQLAYINKVGNTDTACNISQAVTNYNKIVINFVKTNKPYRYVKLMEINFGLETAFDNDSLVSASVLEEIDPISNTISINTLTMTVLNTDQKFNMINPTGVYSYLQKKQQLIASSKLLLPSGNYESVALGTYYLSEWKNSTGLTATLKGTDLMGLLDKTTYYTSPMRLNAVGDTLYNIVSDILTDAGGFPFVIESSLASEPVFTGYIPVMSHREAMQYILIAARAAVKIHRDGVVHIFRPDYSTTVSSIGYDTILGTPTIEQKDLITSVQTTEKTYGSVGGTVTLSTQTVATAGTQVVIITYDKYPAVNVVATLSVGTLVSAVYGACAAKLTITYEGSVTITVTGSTYSPTDGTIVTTLATLSAGEVPQTATMSENMFFSKASNRATLVAQYMLAYYGHRIKQTFDYWDNPSLQAGDNIGVQNMFGVSSSGLIESQEITFSPNLRGRVEVVG